MKRVGVLALQGAFDAHRKAFAEAGAEAVEVRTAAELASVDGLAIPGGESTTMLKLLDMENLVGPLAAFGRAKPIFGTCAGAILIASEVSRPAQASLGLIDIAIERNAYGRQVDSRVVHFPAEPAFHNGDGPFDIEGVFIRAPIIRRVGDGVKVLAKYQGDPVMVTNGKHLVATFHPELTGDRRIHKLFVERFVN